ncbi:ABC transporter permease [Longispora sp. NPDC051575]|uniref:ABC transporter permease n=1 Tax=Longispora sp. NPDC051575 TaxID=3154943 RepID=UPI003447342D
MTAVLGDAWTLTGRSFAHWVRQPFAIVFGLLFPIMLAVLFGFLFGGAMSVPGGGDYIEFLMPGMFVMTMAFGIGETMVSVSADKEKGVTDRFRSMPLSGAAVVLGRSIADMAYSAVLLAVMLAFGLLVGWRAHEGFASALGAVGLLFLLRFSLVWVGVFLGLVVRGAEATAAVQTLLFPLTMVTNTFADPATMPAWLGTVAEWNPLSATVTATRDLFGNPGMGGQEHALALALAWPVLLVAIFLPLSVWRYRRLSR